MRYCPCCQREDRQYLLTLDLGGGPEPRSASMFYVCQECHAAVVAFFHLLRRLRGFDPMNRNKNLLRDYDSVVGTACRAFDHIEAHSMGLDRTILARHIAALREMMTRAEDAWKERRTTR